MDPMTYFTSTNPGERQSMSAIAKAARAIRDRDAEQLAVQIVNSLGQAMKQ